MTEHAARSNGTDVRSDVAAFYDRSVREVYRYFHRATAGDRRLTEDLTQETFMACVRAAGSNADALTMPWLMGVARHKLVDHHRRQSREERKLSLVWSGQPDSQVAPIAFDMTDAEALSALGRLSSQHRLVLVLRYLDDMSVGEVAAAISKSVRATESLLVRARQALETIVKEASNV
jgi:RNA polymerase sigma-70 factor, ECF subfamily